MVKVGLEKLGTCGFYAQAMDGVVCFLCGLQDQEYTSWFLDELWLQSRMTSQRGLETNPTFLALFHQAAMCESTLVLEFLLRRRDMDLLMELGLGLGAGLVQDLVVPLLKDLDDVDEDFQFGLYRVACLHR